MLKRRMLLAFVFTLALPLFAAAQELDAAKVAPESGAAEEGGSSALDLALKSISLSQGEGGVELWRLKAEWGSMQKREDMIFLEQPRLTYFMKEDGKSMHVRSDKGDIQQKKQVMRFIDNVRVTQGETLLTGKLLVYDGAPKTMTMPEGAELSDTGVAGVCNHLIWHIDERRIETTGNIVVHFNSASPEQTTSPASIEKPASSQDGGMGKRP